MFYSGIDQHKRDCFITTYGPDGTLLSLDAVSLAGVAETPFGNVL
jgi:hypothetical protein